MKSSSSISVRILLAVLITVVSVLAVSSVIELKILERREDAALQARGALTADRIANTLAYPVWSLNQAETERVVIHEVSAADVLRIHVLNQDGKLYVGKVKDKTGRLLDVDDNSAANSASLYTFTRELVFKDTRLGSVRLDVTDSHARSELEKLGWGIAIKLLLVAVLLSVVLFLALRSLVLRPLSSLRSWIKSPSGISGPVPHFKGSMEINSLGEAFREMGAILRSKNEELEAERERLERAVTESEDLYNNAPCGYHSLDKDRVYVQVNDTELNWLGLTREEVVGKLRVDEVLTDESRRLLEVKYPEFIAQGVMRDVEYELLCKDGTTKAILLSATAAFDSKGDYLMSRSTLYDIDERKQAEQALRRSEEKFAKAFLSSPVGLAITRLSDGVYLDVNEALAHAVGYSREELLGRSTLELGIWADPNDRQRFMSLLETEKFVREVELKFKSRNGKLINALLSGEVIEIAGEQCLLGVVQDITQRRYIEELLKANETLLRVFIKHAPASIAMFDNNMRYLQVSDRFLADYGLEGQDLTGRGHYEVFPELPDKWREVHSRVLKGAHEKCQEDSYSFDGESTEWVRWEALPWRKPGGEIGGLILMTVLITERKRAELALRASEERFSKIFDLSPFRMGIVRISDGVVLDVNASWVRETGFSREEIVGHKMDELGHWLTDETRRLSREVLREGKSVIDFEGEIFTKSGEKRWVLASAQRVEFDEPCMLWAANDITDRKRAEELLLASERRFAVAFNSNPVMTSISTLESGEFLAVSESFVEITGYSREDAIGNTALGLGMWTDPTERSDMMERLHHEGRVRNVEMQLQVKNGDRRVLLLSAERIEVDGRPCLLHAGIDITERRRAEDENRKLLHNLGERIKELNTLQNASRILQDNELELPEMLREISSLIPRAFQYSEMAAARLRFGDLRIETPNFTSDYPILRTDCETRDGQKGSLEVVYSQERPPEGEGPFLLEERALLNTLADMLKAACERRQAEALVMGQRHVLEMIAMGSPLRETLDALIGLIESQATGMRCTILTLDPDGSHLRHASAPSFSEEFIRSVDGIEIGPEAGSCGTAAYFSEPVFVHDVELDPRWQNSREIASKHGFRACWSMPIFDPHQHVIGTFACYYAEPQSPTTHQLRLIEVATNIAAVCICRKREEEALQASELRYRSLYETAPDAVRVFDSDLRMILINQQGVRLFGYDNAEEMMGLPAGAFVLPEMRAAGTAAVDTVMKTGELVVYETTGVRKDGSTFEMESRLSRILDASGQSALLSVSVDITERKQAETALRQSEEVFRTLAETVAAAIVIYRQGQMIYVNSAIERLTGYSRQEIEKIQMLDLIHPDFRESARQRIAVLEGENPTPQSLEHKMLTKTGEELWMSARAAQINFRGQPALIITSFEITDRKRAEEELQRSEELYRTVVSNVPDSVVTIYDEELRCLTVDGPILEKLGLRREEIIGTRFGEGAYARGEVDTKTFNLVKQDYESVFKGESRTREVEIAGRTFLSRSLPIKYAEKTACMVISLDISNRKRAEEALRASEERYRALFETAPNAISVFDSNLRLVMTNQRAAKLYGFGNADDLLGIDIFRFVAPEDRPRIKDLFTRIKTTGNLELFECLGVRKDGTRFLMETLATLLPNPEGLAPSILTVNTDITERKEAEKALRVSEEQLRALSARMRSAREEEGTRIAREIHDELGGSLTGLKWDLEGIDSQLAAANGKSVLPEVRKRITSMTGLIESTINTVRRISSELRPGVLDDLGLVAAIEWQGQQFEKRTGLKVHFETEEEITEVNREGATAVFRIFQEVLTNVLRHSQAQNIHVKLLELDDEIELEVSDDGRGITEREKRNTRSLGLLGMKERALLVGGNVTIRGSKGRGTTVTVRVPKNYEQI